jgi:AmmeMemoRadiSam system protein B
LVDSVPDTVVILGTTHTGYRGVALMAAGAWETPLGRVDIDEEAAATLVAGSSPIMADDSAFLGFPHGREHCIEVQVPLIKYCADLLKVQIKIVPISLGVFDLPRVAAVAERINALLDDSPKNIAVLASSDMSHVQPRSPRAPDPDIAVMREADQSVIRAFVAGDAAGVLAAGTATTVCGPQTMGCLTQLASLRGYRSQALGYYNSFEKKGAQPPCDYVVGYFSGIVGTG